jgi:excisionase family DNA binding protein
VDPLHQVFLEKRQHAASAKTTISTGVMTLAGKNFVGHDGQLYAVGDKTRRGDNVRPPPKTLMTLQETADYLRVTRSTIHRLLKGNQIPAFRIGRHWRFNLEEIENWCSSHASDKDSNAEG